MPATEGTVEICPECGAGGPDLELRSGGDPFGAPSRKGDPDKRWRCSACGHCFDEPDQREAKRDHIPHAGVGAELEEMDPDDWPPGGSEVPDDD
jgi:hypothetical protein